MVFIGTFEGPSLELLREGMVHWTPCDSNSVVCWILHEYTEGHGQDYPDEAQISVEVKGCAYHLQLTTDKENVRFELLVQKIGGNALPYGHGHSLL